MICWILKFACIGIIAFLEYSAISKGIDGWSLGIALLIIGMIFGVNVNKIIEILKRKT